MKLSGKKSKGDTQIGALKEENKQLKAENRTLRSENKKLKKKLDKLEGLMAVLDTALKGYKRQ